MNTDFKIIIRKILLFIFLYFLLFSVEAQNKITFEHISLKEGLSQSSVSSIVQDSRGFIWFGTYDGLNRYNGYDIEVFRNTDSLSIPDNTINFLFEDSKQNFWIGINKTGIANYDLIHKKFTLYKNIDKDSTSLSNNTVKAICEDKFGQIWVATVDGLNKFDLNTKKFTRYFIQNGLCDNNINHIAAKDNYLWIATNNGLNYLDLNTEQIYSVTVKNNGLANKKVTYVYPDKENLMWIGTNRGLQCFDLNVFNSTKKISFTTFLHKDNENSISDNEITCIMQDHEGVLWIGTINGGLSRYNKDVNLFTVYQNNPFDASSLSINSILTIFEDESGIVWIGTSLGGVNKYNRIAKAFFTYRKNPSDPNSLSSDQLRTIFEDSNGYIWFGTVYGGITKWDMENNKYYHFNHDSEDPETMQDSYVRSILEDKDGEFWIGTDTAGIAKFDPKTGKCRHFKNDPNNPNSISHNKIWKIFQDSKSRIWVCTFGGGLCLFDKKNETFKAYKKDKSNPTSISDNQVTTIFEDKTGHIWVGTWEGGLNLFDTETEEFFKYEQNIDDENFTDRVYCITQDSQGNLWTGNKNTFNKLDLETNSLITYKTSDYKFANGFLMSMIEDNNNNFWITTNEGLVKMNKSTLIIRTYYENDGLQSNEFNVGAYLKTKKGQIIVGGINGVTAFYPEEIEDNNHVPEIAVTSFKILNKEVDLDSNILDKKEIFLSYLDNEFSFEFVALDYSFSEMNQYAYMLEGYDKDWIYCTNRRFASYTNLDPGIYTFCVKGTNNDGVWNKEGVKIKIQISAPFWKKPWFFGLMGLILIGIIFSILKYRDINRDKHQLEAQVQKRTEKIIQQKEEIVAQMEQIENQRNKLESSYKNIKLLSEIGQQITASLSFETIIDIVHKNVNNLMSADIFAIGMYNAEKERLDFFSSIINGHIVPKFYINLSDKDKLAVWCFKNKQEIFINDFENEYSKYISEKSAPILGESSSIIYFPIISKDEISGVMTVQSNEKNAYTNYHLNIIRNLAVYSGIAFDNSHAYNQINHQKKGITDSIFYASRIQSAILTPKIFLDAIFKDYFILFKPRDIVSGDFYWVKNIKINNQPHIVTVAADCTGHGVPGAFMSMLGVSMLNEIISICENNQQIEADVILNELRKSVIKSLHQTGKIGEPQDGMDIALCIINHDTMKLEFAGANNPLYIIRENSENQENTNENYTLTELEPDRMPIGYYMGKEKNFTKSVFNLKNDDTIYIFSDGYIDQFGGNTGKKVLSKNFKRLLLSLQNVSMEEQKAKLEKYIVEWMSFGNKQGKTYPQIDDILIFGVKI